MATVNSLIFLLTTLAPNTEPPKASPAIYASHEWTTDSFLTNKQEGPHQTLQCQPDEEITCFSHCQLNCTNYYDKKFHCPMYCVEGCVCKEPFVRGPGGNCIKHEQCPSQRQNRPVLKQGKNETLQCRPDEEITCFSHCQLNCTNYYDKKFKCPMYCVEGCVCKEPFIRGPGGNCITHEQCPSQRQNKSDKQRVDSHRCQDMSYTNKNPAADDNDILSKMFSSSSESPTCPENEEYSECGDACQKNCRNFDRNEPCEFKCVPGCFCKFPLIRGPGGKCIHGEECPEKIRELGEVAEECPENEFFDKCGPYCEKDCGNYNKPDAECEDKRCKNGCFCKTGYVRSPDRKCVLPENLICPTPFLSSAWIFKNFN